MIKSKKKITKAPKLGSKKQMPAARLGYTFEDGTWVDVTLSRATVDFMRDAIKSGKSLAEIKELLSRRDSVVVRTYQSLVEDLKRDKEISDSKAKPLDYNQLSMITLLYNQGKNLDFVIDAVKHSEEQRILISNAYANCAEGVAPPETAQQKLPLPDPAIIVQQMADNDRLDGVRAQFDFLLDEIKSVRSGKRAKADSYDLVTKATQLFAELIS
jgi:hypothetical protein